MVVRTTRSPRWRARTSSAWRCDMSMAATPGLLGEEGGAGAVLGAGLAVGVGERPGAGGRVEPDVGHAPGAEDGLGVDGAAVLALAGAVGVVATDPDDEEDGQL